MRSQSCSALVTVPFQELYPAGGCPGGCRQGCWGVHAGVASVNCCQHWRLLLTSMVGELHRAYGIDLEAQKLQGKDAALVANIAMHHMGLYAEDPSARSAGCIT